MTDATDPVSPDYAEQAAALPPNKWTFRRFAFFLVVAVLLALRWREIELMPAEDLRETAHDGALLIGLFAILYFIGPTAEHIVRLGKIVQAAWPFGRKA